MGLRLLTTLVVSLGLVFIALPAASSDRPLIGDVGNAVCREQSQSPAVPWLLGQIDALKRIIPSVPAEERRYLEREHEAVLDFARDKALEQQARQRYQLLVNHPWYKIWEFQRDQERALAALATVHGDAVRTYQHKDAEELRRAIKAVGPITKYLSTRSEFLAAVERGKVSVVKLSGEQIGEFAYWGAFFTGVLERFMECRLATVMEQNIKR